MRPPRSEGTRASLGGIAIVARRAWRSSHVRLAAGLAVSAAFLAVTVSRVDLGETARALASAAPGGLLVAVLLVLLELVIRAERWRLLLSPAADVPFGLAFAYLNIGYFANMLLPARLGDAARAYLAGRSFRISPLVTLGTIIVERVLDAAIILGVVLVAGLLVARGSQIAGSAAVLAAAAVVGLAVATIAGVVLLRSGLLERRYARQARDVLIRVAAGAAFMKRPGGAALIVGLTMLAFGVAVCAFGAISGALRLSLGPAEWALVLGVLALSTAVPAAPGSLGTYEFVGVATLGILGVEPSQALAATVLIHVIATLPPAVLGLVSTLVLHVKIADLPAGLGRTDVPVEG